MRNFFWSTLRIQVHPCSMCSCHKRCILLTDRQWHGPPIFMMAYLHPFLTRVGITSGAYRNLISECHHLACLAIWGDQSSNLPDLHRQGSWLLQVEWQEVAVLWHQVELWQLLYTYSVWSYQEGQSLAFVEARLPSCCCPCKFTIHMSCSPALIHQADLDQ